MFVRYILLYLLIWFLNLTLTYTTMINTIFILVQATPIFICFLVYFAFIQQYESYTICARGNRLKFATLLRI